MSTGTPAALHRPGLSSQMATHLTDLIVDGTLRPAQPLPTERELAAQFGVSIGVVREALTSLAALGLIDVRHGIGSFVNPREQWHTARSLTLLVRNATSAVLEVHDVREPLEIRAVEWAAQRASAPDLERLDAALAQMERARTQHTAFIDADMAFHIALASAAHNSLLLAVLQPLFEPIRDCMLHIVQGAPIPLVAERALAEHADIAAAIRAHSRPRARQAMRHHLRTTRAELVEVIAPGQGDGATTTGKDGAP